MHLLKKYYQNWKSHKNKNGKSFNLQHLHSFGMNKKIESGIINIHVMFSNHCFTRSILDDEIENNLDIYKFSSKNRVFDIERYELSLNLKSIIKEMKMKNVFFSKKDDLFYFCVNEEENYFVYFNLVKGDKGLFLLVNSAYPKKIVDLNNHGKIFFEKAVEIIFSGKKLKKPPLN